MGKTSYTLTGLRDPDRKKQWVALSTHLQTIYRAGKREAIPGLKGKEWASSPLVLDFADHASTQSVLACIQLAASGQLPGTLDHIADEAFFKSVHCRRNGEVALPFKNTVYVPEDKEQEPPVALDAEDLTEIEVEAVIEVDVDESNGADIDEVDPPLADQFKNPKNKAENRPGWPMLQWRRIMTTPETINIRILPADLEPEQAPSKYHALWKAMEDDNSIKIDIITWTGRVQCPIAVFAAGKDDPKRLQAHKLITELLQKTMNTEQTQPTIHCFGALPWHSLVMTNAILTKLCPDEDCSLAPPRISQHPWKDGIELFEVIHMD